MQKSNNINISPNNVKGKCELKCAYNFAYVEAQMNVVNNGVSLSLTMEPQTSSPVLYNQEKYNVSKVYLVSPSIHLFDGDKVDAELVIEHTPVLGGVQLNVAIPATMAANENENSVLSELVRNAAEKTPTSNATEGFLLSIDLMQCVPVQPFFSYTEKQKNIDWIVFGKFDALSISSNTLDTLQQIIKPFALPTPGQSLFYNSLGPNTVSQLGDGIYISCKPVSNSDIDETAVTQSNSNKSSTSFQLSNQTIKLMLTILGACLLFVVIFVMLSYGYKKFLE